MIEDGVHVATTGVKIVFYFDSRNCDVLDPSASDFFISRFTSQVSCLLRYQLVTFYCSITILEACFEIPNTFYFTESFFGSGLKRS